MADSKPSLTAPYGALRAVPKPDALADLARAALVERLDEAAVRAKAKELELGDDDGKTPFGDAVAVLARGPEDDAERALARALGALAVAASGEPDPSLVLRLAGKSAFDPSADLDEALGDRADALLTALATKAQQVGDDREPALVACAILLVSKRPQARKELDALSSGAADPLVKAVVRREPKPSETHLSGELVPPPRNPALTVLLGVTGVLFVAALVRLAMRHLLAYRCPADLATSAGGVRIRARTELLGRTLREREIVIGSDALVRAVREVRFPRLGLYAGLLALALGTYIGVGAVVDGVRAASPALLFWGMVLVAGGIALDFVLSSLKYGLQGRCRVLLAPRKGRTVCIGYVDPQRADVALASLAPRR